MTKLLGFRLLGLMTLSAVAWGFSAIPPVRRSGVPVDDAGATCAACHRGTDLNGDPRGSVTIEMADTYRPGIAQTIKVTIRHPEQSRWGFQLTARQSSDLTKMAGTFTEGTNVAVRCGTDPGVNRGTVGPCGGAIEFAAHSNAPRTDAGAGFTFEVQWMPPASEVGEITFYAAGNASNGNNGSGATSGDLIYSTNKKVTLGEAACNNPRPVLSRIVNGASFQPTAAPGALLSILGSALQQPGRTRIVGAGDIVNRAFPKELGCIAVEVNGARTPLLYAQQDQINFQLPSNANFGPNAVVVVANPGRANELRSDQAILNVTAYTPAWFMFRNSTGPVSIAATSADGREVIAATSVLTTGRPARPGETITLYATGLGSTNPASTAGEIPDAQRRISGTATVTVGGTILPAADVLYAGVVPNSINGLYQVNIKLPESLADGDVPVIISVGGNASPSGAGTGAVIPVRRPTPTP